jgi:hypothetical protein
MPRHPNAVTAYIGDLSAWTWSFSRSGTIPIQIRDVDNATASGTSTCVRAGAESRSGADCPPALPDALERAVLESEESQAPGGFLVVRE